MSQIILSDEIQKFDRLAKDWWDPTGPFKPLHDFNPIRVDYIYKQMGQTPCRAIDLGCGGGLVSSSLARLGWQMTAIDASPATIYVAQKYAKQANLPIIFHQTTPEQYIQDHENNNFDCVIALEIIEHVDDIASFMHTCRQLLRPGGRLIMSTLNKTLLSWLMAIVGAEYILQILPRGTHDWQKFLSPAQICQLARECQLQPLDIQGMVYNPFTQQWRLHRHNTQVNYIMTLTNV